MTYQSKFGAIPWAETGWESGESAGVIKRLTAYATRVELPPQRFNPPPVRLRGEPLGTVLWQTRQWAVTGYGLEARDGTYAIKASQLWEGEGTHGWVVVMADKAWVDLPDFAEALRTARRTHRARAGKAGHT